MFPLSTFYKACLAGHGAGHLETPPEGCHSPAESSGWKRTGRSHPGLTGNQGLTWGAQGRAGGQALWRFPNHMSPGPSRAVGVRRGLRQAQTPPLAWSLLPLSLK